MPRSLPALVGLRVSAARRLVLEALFAADGPVTAEEIADGLGGRLPVADLASVYRNLETLEQLGLVRHVHLGHGPGLYALAARQREYLVLRALRRVRAVPPGALDGVRDAVREAFGFEARFTHFPIVGRVRIVRLTFLAGSAARARWRSPAAARARAGSDDGRLTVATTVAPITSIVAEHRRRPRRRRRDRPRGHELAHVRAEAERRRAARRAPTSSTSNGLQLEEPTNELAERT